MITVPDDWTYVADDNHGHYVKTKIVETTITEKRTDAYTRNGKAYPCTIYVTTDETPYFPELASITKHTHELASYCDQIKGDIKVGDKIKITTTARLDVTGDSEPGTAFFTSLETVAEKE